MAPRKFEETTIFWEPKYEFKPVLEAGQVNQIEQYRIFTRCPEIYIYDDDSDGSQPGHKWTMEVHEVPEPGRNQKTILQQLLKTQVKEGNLFKTIESLGYKYSKQFWTRGYEFVSGNVVLQLFRLYGPSASELADSSQQYTLVTWADVANLTDRTAIGVATNELEKMQVDLKGLVSLELPARSQFDSRVRW